MPAYVALLRAVNLGARNKLAMGDLRDLLDDLGYDDVRTHLQSGNAVFRAGTRSARDVEKQVEDAVGDRLGLDIRVLVRTAAHLRKVVATDPFGDRAHDHSRYLVGFCDRRVPAKALADLDASTFEPEELAAVGRELYVWLPKGSHDSRLLRSVTEKKLGLTMTMRTWRVVNRLSEMAGEAGA